MLNLLNRDPPDWNNQEQTKFEHVVDLVMPGPRTREALE